MSSEKHPYRWSFSKLMSFETCPYMYKLETIDKEETKENAFAQFGTFCHELLEDWANKNIKAEDMANRYQDEYHKAVLSEFPPFPKNMPMKYYTAGLNYFKNFTGFGAYTVIGTEKRYEIALENGDTFTGIIDLVLQNPKTKEIVLVDHKSKASGSMKKELKKYIKQLYIYSLFIRKEYGCYPSKLVFNMFRDGEYIVEEFDYNFFLCTMDWLYETIDKIKNTIQLNSFQINDNGYFCNYVCGVRHICPAQHAK